MTEKVPVSCSIRPQEISGGFTAKPRKPRKHSSSTTDGMASVTATITWLETLGRMCRTMMRTSDDADGDGGAHVLDAGQRQRLGAHLAAELRPAQRRHHADDEGDEDVGGRRDRDERGQRQVERQLREGEDELDEALHPDVEPAAEVARGDADEGADDGGQQHHDQRDGQRDLRADDAAREDVAPELVGAQEVDRPAVERAEEVDVGRDAARAGCSGGP